MKTLPTVQEHMDATKGMSFGEIRAYVREKGTVQEFDDADPTEMINALEYTLGRLEELTSYVKPV